MGQTTPFTWRQLGFPKLWSEKKEPKQKQNTHLTEENMDNWSLGLNPWPSGSTATRSTVLQLETKIKNGSVVDLKNYVQIWQTF